MIPPGRWLPALLLLPGLAHGAFDPARWRYRVPIQLSDPTRIAALPVTRDLYSRSREDLGDIRLVSGGQEYSYVLRTLNGSVQDTQLPLTILNQSVRPGGGVQFTADLGVHAVRHSRVHVATPERNFRHRVRVESSDDNRTWFTSRDDAFVFDLTRSERSISLLTIDYPVSIRRFLRVTIYGWSSVRAVSSVDVSYHEERQPERDILATFTPERTEDPKTQSSLLVMDLGGGLPHSFLRVELDPAAGDFHRAVELDHAEKPADWRPVTSGVFFQIGSSRSLSLSYSERHSRYLRLRILNADDRPVPLRRVLVEGTRRLIVFPPPRLSADCWLYFGNPDARTPAYDLATILAERAPQPEWTPTLGEWRDNPDYRAPLPPAKPFSERYPGVLYGLLAASVLAMGVVTVRFLMKVTRVE